MKRPATSPLAPSSTGKDTPLLSKALRDLSGASSLKNERVGHYLATWELSCPLAQWQFNNAVQYVNTATSTQTTREACKAAFEAYAAYLPPPPTAMCELVLNMRAPKSSWRTLSELYTLRKLEYHHPQWRLLEFNLHLAGFSSPLEGVGRPRGIGSPCCHGVAQGHRDLMALRLMGQVHRSSPGGAWCSQSTAPSH